MSTARTMETDMGEGMEAGRSLRRETGPEPGLRQETE